MAKRTYALASGVGLFVDDETGLKLVPGANEEFDEAKAGARTQIAIRHKAIVEVEAAAKATAAKGEGAKTEGDDKAPNDKTNDKK